MTDRDDRKVIVPTNVDPAPVSKISAADMMRMDHVPRGMIDGRPDEVKVIYVQAQPEAKPEYRGDDLLRKFVPYFVIAGMLLILLGGLAAIFVMLLPMIIAAIGALVSIVISLVATVIAGVVIAVGIGYLQAANSRASARDWREINSRGKRR